MDVIDHAEQCPCDSDDDGIPVCYAFEIEFLVAKEHPDTEYPNDDDDDDDDSDNSISQLRWACPSDEEDTIGAILDRCKDLLVQNNEPVTICYDPSYPDIDIRYFNEEMSGDSDRFGYWHLEPCGTAHEKKGSPANYDWFGIRLRSPMFSEAELNCKDSNVKWVLGALRMGLTMHVNSTCRFNVLIQPRLDAMSLLTAKKLATLVWVLERDLLLQLCPGLSNLHWPHVKPVNSRSRIASTRWRGRVESNRPEDPLRAGIMDQHLPRLHNEDIQEKLHDVWGAASLRELAKGLCCNDGSPSALAIHVYGDDELDARHPPAAEFRYALWHPYSTLDASNYWIQLCISLFKATSHGSFDFKAYLGSIDDIVRGFSQGVPASSRWKILLDKLELTEDWAAPWERIVEEYRHGRQLGYPAIDRHAILDQIDELKDYK